MPPALLPLTTLSPTSPLLQASGWLLGLVMTMCLLFPVGMLVMAVVDEKEHRYDGTRLKHSG